VRIKEIIIRDVKEEMSTGATGYGNIATIANPQVTNPYLSNPPKVKKPKKQKPTDNALDMKNVSLFGGPAKVIKR
jgi:hypothetical protein